MARQLRTPDGDDRPWVTVRLNGRAVAARQGERLSSALWARGRRILSRSMRYHRARGLLCGTGECTHCLLRVGGVPNVRACQVACHDGLWAEDQNAFPNVRFDLLEAADVVWRDHLDAHRAFIRPRLLRPLTTRVIRGMAGFGRVPRATVPQRFDRETATADVLVVGGGPAGLQAAEAAAAAGVRVLLAEREERLGGRLAWTRRTEPAGEETAEAWVAQRREALASSGVDVRTGCRLLGVYADGGLVAATATRLLRVRAPRLVLATGSRDAYLPFPGADRAGVLLATAAQRLLNEDGVLPGRRPVVLGATWPALALVDDLAGHGVHVDRLFDPRPEVPADVAEAASRIGVPLAPGHAPTRAVGRRGFRRVTLEGPGGTIRVRGDVLVVASGRAARSELAQQAGCGLTYRSGAGFVVTADAAGATGALGVWAAGSVTGAATWRQAAAQGMAAGAAAAAWEAPA